MPDRTTMSPEEIKVHLANGRTVLVSPIYGKDDDGNYVEKHSGSHITHPSQVENAMKLSPEKPKAEPAVNLDEPTTPAAKVIPIPEPKVEAKPEPAPAKAPEKK